MGFLWTGVGLVQKVGEACGSYGQGGSEPMWDRGTVAMSVCGTGGLWQ